MFTKKNVLTITGVLVIIICVSIILFSASGFVNPYHSVSEIAGDTASFMNRQVQIMGNIVNGSIQTLSQDINFIISDGKSELKVIYSGATPQNFMDGIEVVIKGNLIMTDTFKANQILTKCPSKYQ